MNSKEIVLRTLEYQGSDRVARSFGDSDMASCGNTAKTYATPWKKTGQESWEMTDEWGNLWHRIDPTSKGEVVKGVLEDALDLSAYEFPDFSNMEDYRTVKRCRAEHPDKWIIGSVPGFAFNIARKLFKLENYLVNLLLETEAMHALHDRIDGMLLDMIRNYDRK